MKYQASIKAAETDCRFENRHFNRMNSGEEHTYQQRSVDIELKQCLCWHTFFLEHESKSNLNYETS